MPTDYVIVPLGRRMHYEITADKSVLHSRGQPTAFMNENLYCSLASRGRARSTPRRPRTDAETTFNNLSSPHLLSIFPPLLNRDRVSTDSFWARHAFLLYCFPFSFPSVSRDRRQGTSRNLESFLNPFNSSLPFTE